MDKKHRGCWAELVATAWLLDQGYDVFRNVSQHGLADIFAVKFDTGQRLLVDVKSSSVATHISYGVVKTYENISNKLTPAQKAGGVKMLVVMRDGRCVWVDDGLDLDIDEHLAAE